MYYYTDENGMIHMSETSENLQESYQEVFPYEASETVSSGNNVNYDDILDYVEQNFNPDPFITDNNIVTYDDMIDLLAAIPGYNVYPNTTAVNVFTDVLNGVNGNIGYVILSGADTNSTYLYYSKKYTVSGQNITLQNPVTFCNYYQYRPSTNAAYIYTYNVSTIGDTSFNITNQLVYTNILDGYPDVLPYKQRETYSIFFLIGLAILIIMGFIISRQKRVR